MSDVGVAYAEVAVDVIVDYGMEAWLADMLGALLRRRADLDRQIESVKREMQAAAERDERPRRVTPDDALGFVQRGEEQ